MKKYVFGGREYIRLSTLRHEIKRLRESIARRHGGFSAQMIRAERVAYGDIIRAVWAEEREALMAHAHTPEEIRAADQAIGAIPGEFAVCRTLRDTPPGRRVEAFVRWEGGEAVIGHADEAMMFAYETMAQEVAERLNETHGEGWHCIDASEEAAQEARRLLDAIFREDEDGGEAQA